MALAVVLGIGNLLLSDDGAGIHAARLLADELAAREDVQVLDAGTLSFTLAPVVETADRLIILDATQLDEAPGTLRCFFDAELDLFLGRSRLSVHEIGLRDVMDIVRLAGALPPRRALIGIQPASLDWGTSPTPCVAAQLHSMTRMALNLIDAWPAHAQSNSRAA